jgi:hypothetical protein
VRGCTQEPGEQSEGLTFTVCQYTSTVNGSLDLLLLGAEEREMRQKKLYHQASSSHLILGNPGHLGIEHKNRQVCLYF